jgi:hypothetical protein
MSDQDQRAVIQGLRELNAKRTQGGEIAWLESQIAETERCIKAREQAEATWSGGDSETWRSVGCKLTKAGRSAVAEKEGRIAVKYRCDLECLKNLLALANACGELLDAAERGLEAEDVLAKVYAENEAEVTTLTAERDEITNSSIAIHGENVTIRAELVRLRELLVEFGKVDLELSSLDDAPEDPDDPLVDRHVATYEAIKAEARKLAQETQK